MDISLIIINNISMDNPILWRRKADFVVVVAGMMAF